MTPADDIRFRETTTRFWVLQLVTEVQDDGLHIRLGPIQRSFRHIPVEQIQTVQVTSYTATDYAGWHWGVHQTLGGNTVYRLYGGQGVEVVLADGTQWFIGSRRADALQSTLEQITADR